LTFDQQRNDERTMPVAPSRNKNNDQKSVASSSSSETTSRTTCCSSTTTPIKSQHQHDSSLTQCLSSSCDFDESLTSLCAAGASLDLNQHIPSRESREEKLLQVLGPFCPDDDDEQENDVSSSSSFGGQDSFASDDFLHFSGGDRSGRLSFNKSGGVSFSDLHTIPENSPSVSKDETSD
jgi:hypothetical protein